MGICGSTEATSETTNDINRQIAEDRRRLQKEVKLLLLGKNTQLFFSPLFSALFPASSPPRSCGIMLGYTVAAVQPLSDAPRLRMDMAFFFFPLLLFHWRALFLFSALLRWRQLPRGGHIAWCFTWLCKACDLTLFKQGHIGLTSLVVHG